MKDLSSALWLSLRIAFVATAVTALVTIPFASWMTRRKFKGKSLLECLFLLPLVLPPTVVGYVIIILLGARGLVGSLLSRWFGYSIVFRFEGAVLAAAVVALPMMYIPTKAGFAAVSKELEDVAKLFGATRLQTFWHVSLPLARRGVFSGLVLSFARALGEFGATVMVFGWLPGRVTLPISIYTDYEQGNFSHAGAAVLTLTAVSFGMILLFNRSVSGRQEGS
jgi:molybdate transport system permease protein